MKRQGGKNPWEMKRREERVGDEEVMGRKWEMKQQGGECVGDEEVKDEM
jgi:hypothetical protein